MIPVARTSNLIVTNHDDGLVVYDSVDHHAHSLNAVSAFVWLAADGVTTVDEISARLGAKLGGDADRTEMRALVLMALGQLQEKGLVLSNTSRREPAEVPEAITRRAAAAAIGKAALLVGGILPAVYSLVAPEPAFADSGVKIRPVTGTCALVGAVCRQDSCTGDCVKVHIDEGGGSVEFCNCI